ncbi:MAG: hypothetical protein J6B19_04950 [Lachnospiraceae bacterium]|nr:hypothetical protein [Lachnospiraceae bacterium]
MKKKTVLQVISVFLTLILIVSLVYTLKTRTEISEEVSETVLEAEPQEVVEDLEQQEIAIEEETEEEITEQDINDLKLQIEIAQSNVNMLERANAVYAKMSEGYTEEEINRIVDSEVMKCYQENTLLAIEMKTLIMGSFGVQVPTMFGSGESPTKQYEDYIKESVSDLVISQVADEDVQEILKNGWDGALEAYESDGTLTGVLEGAFSSAVNGVVAKIQEAPANMMLGILDETTGGLATVATDLLSSESPEEFLKSTADEKLGGVIGSVSAIADYDTTPTTLLSSLSATASSSAESVKAFINKETVTSKDIGDMMYQYSQFGNAMDAIGKYGGSVSFNWRNNYEKMEVLYERFVHNEIMIEMLKKQRQGEVDE